MNWQILTLLDGAGGQQIRRPPSTMEIPMPAPICLIENSPARELRVQQEALRVLAEISQRVVVVAIAGLYRTEQGRLGARTPGSPCSAPDELENRICQGVYLVSRGYQRFLDDRQHMVERYRQVPGKGVKAEEVLQEFLQSKEAVAQSILQTDEALTEKEKEMAAERARAQAAEREQQVLKQKEAELQQKLEDQERSYRENLRQLEMKLEDERKKLLEEQGKMMDQKLKKQEALLREGFREEAGRLESEIRRPQQQNEEIRKPSWIQTTLQVLAAVAPFVLPGVSSLVRRMF
ncbi:guanylate-binding protein 7-like [Pangshura tecta]